MICPKCGFHQPLDSQKCHSCGYEFGSVKENYEATIRELLMCGLCRKCPEVKDDVG